MRKNKHGFSRRSIEDLEEISKCFKIMKNAAESIDTSKADIIEAIDKASIIFDVMFLRELNSKRKNDQRESNHPERGAGS